MSNLVQILMGNEGERMRARRPMEGKASRTIARVAAVAAFAAMLGGLVAGCGGSSGIEGDSTSKAPQAKAGGPVKGELTISQWPLYIDPGKNGTIAQFEGDTGVGVHYIEDINDNAEFFGKMQPLLAK